MASQKSVSAKREPPSASSRFGIVGNEHSAVAIGVRGNRVIVD
jgi:hypothetical protein